MIFLIKYENIAAAARNFAVPKQSGLHYNVNMKSTLAVNEVEYYKNQ